MEALKYPCAICGVREATTRDHIPPKAIFVRPLPTTLVTVPACALCNNGASGHDEHFRVYLGMVVGDRNPKATQLWKERSMATLRKNKKLVSTISQGMHKVELRTDTGQIVGDRSAFLWPANIYESVVERIARGLYYHHFGDILGMRAECNVGFLHYLSDSYTDASKNWPEGHIGEGAFSYRYNRADEHPLNSLWVFEFYQGHWASVETVPADS